MKDLNLFEIFKVKLVTQSTLECLQDLIENKSIVYDPYYQRHYVWSIDKATAFIESVLIGTEIPPIVIFEENPNYSEIIDGRQRFETIKRFMNNEFKLKNTGLSVLKTYKDKYFRDLPEQVQNYFKNTMLRIFRYRVVSDDINNPETLDSIKKEIFRRYNIGLTPLKQYEIEKAIFIRNDLNRYVKKSLKSDMRLLRVFNDLFLKKVDDSTLLSVKNVEMLMKKFRFLISLPEIPINYYSWSAGKNDLINAVFKYISNDSNPTDVFSRFRKNIMLIDKFRKSFDRKKNTINYLISEVLYWMISVINYSKLDISILENNIDLIVDKIIENKELFEVEQTYYYKKIIARYLFMRDIAQSFYNTDFEEYITTSEYSKAKIKKARDIRTKKETLKFISKLQDLKPDSHSVTVKTCLSQIQQKSFNLKPSYQREECMNIQKASSFIESMLLDFKIAPIFLYKRTGGVHEVIDGQQRLLSLIAFTGRTYLDSKNNILYSSKHQFKLTGLKYLKELNGLTFEQLPEELQERLLNFSLAFITLNEAVMPNFDPVDLFIRLNNKPYPIKEHSFEMWNATMSAKVTEKIKEIAKTNSDWMYCRIKKYNNHMQNEEMISTIMYLENEHMHGQSLLAGNACKQFRIYAQASHLGANICDKKNITQMLAGLSTSQNIENYTNMVENYIAKARGLLDCENMELKDRLNELICTTNGKRTRQKMFLLWYILTPIEHTVIAKHKDSIYEQIKEIFELYKQEYQEDERDDFYTAFQEKIQNFWNVYINN